MKSIEIRTAWTVAVMAVLALANTTWAKMPSSPSPSGNQPEATMSPQQRTSLNATERNFLQSAAEISATEVQLGQIAQRQSNDPNIKKIGEQLAKDHSTALQQVEKLAASKGLSLVTQPTSMQERRIQSLQGKSGDEFNKQFLRQNVTGHLRAISLFERASRRATDPDVKAWATQMLPSLQDHLAMVRSGKPEAVAEKTTEGQPPQKSPRPIQEQGAPGGSPKSGY